MQRQEDDTFAVNQKQGQDGVTNSAGFKGNAICKTCAAQIPSGGERTQLLMPFSSDTCFILCFKIVMYLSEFLSPIQGPYGINAVWLVTTCVRLLVIKTLIFSINCGKSIV